MVFAREYGKGPDFPVREIYSIAALSRPRAFRTTGNGTLREDCVLGRCHTFDKIVGAKEFFKDHPEYFALRDGKRLGARTQPCLANPDVLRIAKERVLKRVLENPNAKFFGVSQNDNGNYCTCPSCAAVDAEEGSHAGAVVRFVNAIAAEVAKVRKDAVVTTLAYMYSRKPPKTPLAPNAAVWLCTTDVDFSRPLDGGGEANDSFMDDLRAWREKAPQGVYVWDYAVNFRHCPMPFPNLRAMSENFRVYRDNGVKGVFLQGSTQTAGACLWELKSHLASRLMWNADAPAGEIVREFTDAFYGPAAPKVREIIDFLEDLPKTIVRFDESVCSRWLDDGAVEKLDAMWREAEKLAGDDDRYSRNARIGRLSAVYTRFSRSICRMAKNAWLCRSPAEYARRESALEDLAWINRLLAEVRDKDGGRVEISGLEDFSRTSGRWSRFLMKKIPSSGGRILVLPEKNFFLDGESGLHMCNLDDTAFDEAAGFSLSVGGLPPGSDCGIRDTFTGEDVAVLPRVGAGNGSLRVLAPIPAFGAVFWFKPPAGDFDGISEVTLEKALSQDDPRAGREDGGA